MVVALRALNLRAEEEPRDGGDHLIRIRINGEIELRTILLGLENLRGNPVVGFVGFELPGQPFAEPAASAMSNRPVHQLVIARQHAQIKHLRLVASVTRVRQQLVDQFCPLLRIGVGQKRRRFLPARDHADEVEVDTAQEHRIGGTHRWGELFPSPDRLDFAIDRLGKGCRPGLVVHEHRKQHRSGRDPEASHKMPESPGLLPEAPPGNCPRTLAPCIALGE